MNVHQYIHALNLETAKLGQDYVECNSDEFSEDYEIALSLS